jgi:hypothetical protein
MPGKINSSKIKWFLEEIPKLKSAGLIDQATGEKITGYYKN